MNELAPPASAMALQIWLSPAFPVGSFAYSHGLEAAIERGDIADRATAQDWLAALFDHGGPHNDAILLAAAWRAASDLDALAEVNDLALALAGSRERHLESSAQGNAFVTTVLAAWPVEALANARAGIAGDLAFPVAVGVAAAAHGIALAPTIQAFLTALVSNLTAALVRLGAIGQTDGQRIVAAVVPRALALARVAENSTPDDLGGCAFRSDLSALHHETQHSRLFRS